MSSLPVTGNSAASNFFIGEGHFPEKSWQEKQARVLKHIAASRRLAEVRPASRLEVRPRPEMIPSGVAEIDAMTGGLPRGCLSEICGSASSGKTGVLLAAISAATRRQESCVLIDASDSFDPQSGAAAGINFEKLLWVRCGKPPVVGRRPSDKKSMAIRRWPPAPKFNDEECFANDQPRSTQDIFPDDRQPNTDESFLHDSQRATHDVAKTRSERRLAQLLKTTDLVLQSGGFGLVALDLAGIPEKFVRRIPLASWFRFQRAVEHTKTALLVVSGFPCAQTCASVVLKFSARCAGGPTPVSHIAGETGRRFSSIPGHAQLLERLQVEAELARTRLQRKPVQSANTSFITRAIRAG